jgi:hypothetical protein
MVPVKDMYRPFTLYQTDSIATESQKFCCRHEDDGKSVLYLGPLIEEHVNELFTASSPFIPIEDWICHYIKLCPWKRAPKYLYFVSDSGSLRSTLVSKSSATIGGFREQQSGTVSYTFTRRGPHNIKGSYAWLVVRDSSVVRRHYIFLLERDGSNKNI